MDTELLNRAERQADVVRALSAVLPAHALLWQTEDTVPYECDGLTAYRQRPLVVALPETTRTGAGGAQGLPRAGRAGGGARAPEPALGGAMPHAWGVTLSLAKFNKILKLDKFSRTAVVSAACAIWPSAGGRTAGPVLRAGPVEPDRLHDRRQRGRELRRRALPEIRPDAAQRAQGARLHHRGEPVTSWRRRAGHPGLDLLPW